MNILPGLMLSLCLTLPAPAALIVDTFGPGDSYNSSNGYLVAQDTFLGSSRVTNPAFAFTPGATAQVGSIAVALNAPAGTFRVAITETFNWSTIFPGALPGPTLGAIETLSITTTGGSQIFQVDSLLHPTLTAGVQYWLRVEPASGWGLLPPNVNAGTWYFNDQSLLGSVSRNEAFCRFPCPATVDLQAPLPAARITSYEPAETIPEPATVSLLGAGLAAVVVLLRRSAV